MKAEMSVGMLWFDADPSQQVSSRIERAASHYKSKYGRTPNVCFAHPSTLGNSAPQQVGGMRVKSSGMVLPNHFWLGVEDFLATARTGS